MTLLPLQARRPWLQGRSCIMGILNITPDSFSDGGRFFSIDAAVEQGRKLWQDGADILDLGAESTRPGAADITLQEEMDRLLPVLEALQGEIPIPISVDTRKAAVMRAAHALGVTLINDISALSDDPDALRTVAELGLDVCLMHKRGSPATMQQNTRYENVVLSVKEYLQERLAACVAAGLARDGILLDPGIGFAKDDPDNFQLLRRIRELQSLGQPLLLGISRKGFLGRLTGLADPGQRDLASHSAMLWVESQLGRAIYRVHDVAGARQALRIWNRLGEREERSNG